MLAATLCLLLPGCAPQIPGPQVPAPVPVESEAVAPAPDAPSKPVEVPDRAAPGPAAPVIAQADPARLAEALVRHREKLLEQSELSLSADEAGYYLDTLEARLIQLLRNTGVRYERADERFEMRLASGSSFASDTARLTEAALEQLRPVIGVLVEYHRTRILIYGHTDAMGDASYNLALSERRAAAVARLLIEAGVDPRRILVAGFGEERPVADNGSDDGRAQNRRIELAVEALVQ